MTSRRKKTSSRLTQHPMAQNPLSIPDTFYFSGEKAKRFFAKYNQDPQFAAQFKQALQEADPQLSERKLRRLLKKHRIQ